MGASSTSTPASSLRVHNPGSMHDRQQVWIPAGECGWSIVSSGHCCYQAPQILACGCNFQEGAGAEVSATRCCLLTGICLKPHPCCARYTGVHVPQLCYTPMLHELLLRCHTGSHPAAVFTVCVSDLEAQCGGPLCGGDLLSLQFRPLAAIAGR